MLPTVGADSVKIIRYSAEVAGRVMGIAAMTNLVPEATRRAALTQCGNAILTVNQALLTAFFARIQFESIDQRVSFGKGKGIDRGFDAVVATISESVRTSLADRHTSNPDYRAIFPNGTEEMTSPTIREDEAIAEELRSALAASNLTVKSDALALIDTAVPVIGPAATALRNAEQHLNGLVQAELNARKDVVDALWEQRKIVETQLGRAGKALARFVFFDFRKAGESETATPAPPETGNTPPAVGG